ncbi:MAG: nucleoside deaminase [Ancrocorticia sp.]
MTAADSFDIAKATLPIGAWRALEKAHQAIASDGLPCGAALVDDEGLIVADGRCSAFDLQEGGTEFLGTTPLGHAEMNVLARVPTARDLSNDTLWSTQQPCAMCTAALDFVGVGTVRYLAADPAFQGTSDPNAGQIVDPTVSEPNLEPWAIFGNALFLQGSLNRYGTDGGAVVRNLKAEPETADLAISLWSENAFAGPELQPLAKAVWPRVITAVQSRRCRLEHDLSGVQGV